MTRFPEIVPLGLEGFLIRFDDAVSDAGNGAALALARAVERADFPGLREVAPALTSVAVFFDPLAIAPEEMHRRLNALALSRDWASEPLPQGRVWTVPVCFEGAHAPQLADVAAQVGCSESRAVDVLCAAPLRVLGLGFAPGQPYMGILPPEWNIPRQTDLTPNVSEGAVVVAVRQVIIFATSAPTGWRQVGQSSFCPFQRGADDPLVFAPGDRVQLQAVSADQLRALSGAPIGGAKAIA